MKAKSLFGQLVGARRKPSTLFDLIEEPLDQATGTMEIRAEADRLVAIASGRK